jgi:hypothetical protein
MYSYNKIVLCCFCCNNAMYLKCCNMKNHVSEHSQPGSCGRPTCIPVIAPKPGQCLNRECSESLSCEVALVEQCCWEQHLKLGSKRMCNSVPNHVDASKFQPKEDSTVK